jgi:hypothetical protein
MVTKMSNTQPAPPPKNKPLQLKRGTAKAFRKVNPLLLEGQPAFEIDSNRMKIGNGKTYYNDLPYIGEGDGKSAYELWIESGNEGTVEDFLNSLVGATGQSTYEAWLSLGNEGTIADFLNSLIGEKGDQGLSAFEVWRDEFMKDPSLTIEDYIEFICSCSWANINT